MFLTFKYRVKDATVGKYLDRHSRAANFVWNYCCEIQRKAEANYRAGGPRRGWPTHFDLCKLTTGCAADLGLHSDTVNQICKQFIISRNAIRCAPRFRASGGPNRSIGWIPFIPRALKVDSGCVVYLQRRFHFWKSREIEGEFRYGCFTQDARGRWYIALQCEVADDLPTGNGEVGIDLGLKALATCSDGAVIPALQHYRRYERALAVAQRAGNKRRAKAIHAKITNARRDQLHKATTKIACENELIVVGNVNAASMAKTRMAKSVLDAGWAMFRNMLEYKASRHRARYVEADERMTSQTCSDCGVVGGPKGIAGLGVRHWDCPGCGASHDRDVNAARNILRVGAERRPPAVEIPVL